MTDRSVTTEIEVMTYDLPGGALAIVINHSSGNICRVLIEGQRGSVPQHFPPLQIRVVFGDRTCSPFDTERS